MDPWNRQFDWSWPWVQPATNLDIVIWRQARQKAFWKIRTMVQCYQVDYLCLMNLYELLHFTLKKERKKEDNPLQIALFLCERLDCLQYVLQAWFTVCEYKLWSGDSQVWLEMIRRFIGQIMPEKWCRKWICETHKVRNIVGSVMWNWETNESNGKQRMKVLSRGSGFPT